MTGREEDSETPFLGTGFEAIGLELADAGRDLNLATDKRDEIEQQMDDAIAAAVAPFVGPLRDAKVQLGELEGLLKPEVIAEKIKETDFEGLSLTALDLILRRSNTTLTNFSEGIKDLALGINDFRGDQSARHLKELRGFSEFERDLRQATDENDKLPVGVFKIGWEEHTDSQAEFEGRDSRTGIYVKDIEATIGLASADALSLEHQDISPEGVVLPVFQVSSIMLGLQKAILIKGYTDWGQRKSKLTDLEQTDIELLAARDSVARHYIDTAINWRQSANRNFPLVDSKKPNTIENNRFIVWGGTLSSVINRLMEDEYVPRTAKANLVEAKNRIVSV